jgi:GNAT superfamily N-acetyltransferase
VGRLRHDRIAHPVPETVMSEIRLCGVDERSAVLEIINAAAEAYRGVIPPDCWHEPYMPARDLEREIAAGVEFWGYESEGRLAGVMGIQPVRDVDLIRHAYVRPDFQGRGVGAALITHLRVSSARRMLVGTWSAASWAIRFYQHHNFQLLSAERTRALLTSYWTITARQVETSVVLANPPFKDA